MACVCCAAAGRAAARAPARRPPGGRARARRQRGEEGARERPRDCVGQAAPADSGGNAWRIGDTGVEVAPGEAPASSCIKCFGVTFVACPRCQMQDAQSCPLCGGKGLVPCPLCNAAAAERVEGAAMSVEERRASVASPWEPPDARGTRDSERPRQVEGAGVADESAVGAVVDAIDSRPEARANALQGGAGSSDGSSAGKRPRRKMSAEHRAKISASMKGKNRARKSEEHRAAISDAMRDALAAPEVRQRMSKGRRAAGHRCSICGQEGHNRRTCPLIRVSKSKNAG